MPKKAAQIAVDQAKKQEKSEGYVPYLIGEMMNQLTAAQVQWKDMIRITNDYDFEPVNQNAQDILMRKTNVANACVATVTKAMEVVGGAGFYKKLGLERLFRDVQACSYHPLAAKKQKIFTGELVLKNNI